MSKPLTGKVAIVTGASRGLGNGFARELATQGANVAAVYASPTSEQRVHDLAAQLKLVERSGQCIGIRADLREASSAAEIVQQTRAQFGPHIDIVVNNAGAEVVKPLTDLTTDDFNYVFSLNVLAPLQLLQAARPHLRPASRIINIGSVGARAGFKDLSVYCASKAALEGMTRCWAAELGSEGHTVNVINVGPVQSDMLDNIPKDIVDMQKKQTPIQNRLGTVDDIAQVVAWLASEGSRWVTGQTLSASGGWAMY